MLEQDEPAPRPGGPRLSRRALIGGLAVTAVAPWLVTEADGQAAPRAALPPAALLPRQQHTATPLGGGYVLLAGGTYQGVLDDAQVVGPDGAIFAAAPLTTPRFAHAAVLLPYGRVLVLGGYNNGPLDDAEVYDPASNTWSPARPLALPRYSHTAVRVSNTQVLVVGGTYQGVLSGLERYSL
jgi:hypothetical protein